MVAEAGSGAEVQVASSGVINSGGALEHKMASRPLVRVANKVVV